MVDAEIIFRFCPLLGLPTLAGWLRPVDVSSRPDDRRCAQKDPTPGVVQHAGFDPDCDRADEANNAVLPWTANAAPSRFSRPEKKKESGEIVPVSQGPRPFSYDKLIRIRTLFNSGFVELITNYQTRNRKKTAVFNRNWSHHCRVHATRCPLLAQPPWRSKFANRCCPP